MNPPFLPIDFEQFAVALLKSRVRFSLRNLPMTPVRTRIAPSPTGDPHVGTAYIALFNLCFARAHVIEPLGAGTRGGRGDDFDQVAAAQLRAQRREVVVDAGGHGLVADDVVDCYRTNQTTIEGKCPQLLQNLLEVRGIGLLDMRAIFGEAAVRRKMRLKLIVHLLRADHPEKQDSQYERLPLAPLTQDVLGVPVLKVIIQVVAGRNIAVLVEVAVRNTILQLRGIHTAQDFLQRQRAAMNAAAGE